MEMVTVATTDDKGMEIVPVVSINDFCSSLLVSLKAMPEVIAEVMAAF